MSVDQFADALRHGMELSAALENGELEYHFVKGKGWIPSYGPIELTVTDSQLQVGDVILEWRFANGQTTNRGYASLKVASITDDWVAVSGNRQFHRLGSVGYNSKVVWWRIQRS